MCILPEIDECEKSETNNCEQICVNVPGSFFCDCRDGYKLSANKHNCKGKEPCNRDELRTKNSMIHIDSFRGQSCFQ